MLEIEGSDPYSSFLYGMRSPKTKEKCIGRFQAFLDFIQIPGEGMTRRCKVFCEMINNNNTGWLLANILKFLQYKREKFERKEIAGNKKFCNMNDIPVPRKKIWKGLPRVRKFGEDRAPTVQEIRKIIEYRDRRIKAIVCIMVSLGIRLGAWDFLKFKHIVPLNRDGKIVAAKLIVYAG